MTGELARRFLPVIIGARVGDAMGAPTEGLASEEIERHFGWVSAFAGDGTDDSLMATLLSEALVRTGGHADVDDWAEMWVIHRDLILEKRESFFISVIHTSEKLVYGFAPRLAATGNMPSSSSAMCIWPVGLVNAGNPEMAAAQAYGLASLIHTGEVDFCRDAAAAVAAAVAAGVRPGTTISDAARAALGALHPVSGASMRSLISDAMHLASESTGYQDFRSRYQATFLRPKQCDSRETVPAAFALAVLADGRLDRGVEYAVNLGRDTDTIATMAGALCGAVSGPTAIPETWTKTLEGEAFVSAEVLADQLAQVARAKADKGVRLARTMPGLLSTDCHNAE